MAELKGKRAKKSPHSWKIANCRECSKEFTFRYPAKGLYCTRKCFQTAQKAGKTTSTVPPTNKHLFDDYQNLPDTPIPPVLTPALAEIAARTMARRSLLFFARKTHPDYKPGWVHADICRRLERFSQQVIDKKRPRLMLLMPPRAGKSELASIRFPAWHLGRAPTHEIINVGYNLDLPMVFSRRVRELLRDPLYKSIFPGTALDPESQSIEKWNTTAGGGSMAAGVGGGITGKGAHVLIIDDPIKNIEEADSAMTRDSLWQWYLSTAYTRLAPGGGVLLIQTCWNDDDLAGRLVEASKQDALADQFEIVKYPALAEEYEYRNEETLEIIRYKEAPRETPLTLLRAPGDVLHPERYDLQQMLRIKATMTPRLWSALYQQNPVPDEGMYFRKEYLKYQIVLPNASFRNVYTAWDFAIGEKSMNDWTVGATAIQDELDILYIPELVRFRGDSFVIVEEILNCAERWMTQPNVGYTMGFEDGQIWRAIKPLLEKRMQERKLYPSYEVLKPFTDKIARARPLQGRMQQGRVVFPERAAWRPEMEQELLRFPAGVHDDIVDALAWVVHLSMGHAAPRPQQRGNKLESWLDKLEHASQIDAGHMAA